MAYELVLVGASLGGLTAMEVMLASLPPGFPAAVAIVMHRSADSRDALTRLLRAYSTLPVREPYDKEALRPSSVYIAPADYHLLVEPGAFALTTDAPVCHARPSIDVLFESGADAYGPGVVGVVLTGASADGARGVRAIRQRGGYVIAQEPSEAESAIMPTAAIEAGADCVLPLNQIAARLATLCPLAR